MPGRGVGADLTGGVVSRHRRFTNRRTFTYPRLGSGALEGSRAERWDAVAPDEDGADLRGVEVSASDVQSNGLP
jgi:hypothetical protein